MIDKKKRKRGAKRNGEKVRETPDRDPKVEDKGLKSVQEKEQQEGTGDGAKEGEMRSMCFLLFPAGPGCGHHGLETRCVQFCSESSFTVSDPICQMASLCVVLLLHMVPHVFCLMAL